MLTFADPLIRAEQCFGDQPAVVDGQTRLDFATLVDRCRRLAGAIQAGSERGDRIAVLAANSHRVLEAYLATPASGRLYVPLNTRLAEPELAYALEDSGARLLLTDRGEGELGSLADRVERVISLDDDYEQWIAGAPAVELGEGVDEDDVAGLFYTGGTTGQAKGVMLTHRNKLADTLHLETCVRLTADDTWLVMSPMHHAAGTFHALLCVWLGARQVFVPAFEAGPVLDAIEREGVTIVFGVPAMLAALVDEQAARPRDTSRLRLMGYGAAPASSTLLARFHERFPTTELVSMYGATELGPMGTALEHMERYIGSDRVRSGGRPLAGVRIRVVGEEGKDLAIGEVGEVIARGPNVMKGYWKKPEQTASVMRDGWYHTGDLGFFDAAGCLHLVDRAKDMIVSGGENVYSTEVEEALYQHPEVAECAVFGVPDTKWGEAVHAVVVPRENAHLDEAALRTHCRGLLGGYKIPKAIEIRETPLPRSAAGKVLKRELRAPHWEGRERNVS
ncbi:MAG: long-chain-fatty-acid--CoA ligase [Deltaproteobacteria bacterium]|jgi:long-chain acyl-CoA synthetase|nr:long-chain-fatty-acid--CoA ligase [Deltaproteobacteria bacterium]